MYQNGREGHRGFVVEVANRLMPYEFLIDIYAQSGKLPDGYEDEKNYSYSCVFPASGKFILSVSRSVLQPCRLVLVESEYPRTNKPYLGFY